MSMSNENKLIPKLRFPEFKKAGEWEMKRLGEVIHKNDKRNKENFAFPVQSISNKFGFIDQEEYFDDRILASNDKSNYYIIEKGYFAYNPSRINVGSLAYKNDDKVSIISPLYISFFAEKKLIEDLFLFYWFGSKEFIKQMNIFITSGVRNTLGFENLIKIQIPVPSLSEQQKIAACLSSLDEFIAAERQKLELLKAHKKGLLQNLFPQEDETVPKLRFPEFKKDGEWEVKRLGEVAIELVEKTKGRKFKLLSITAGQGLVSQIEKFGREIAGNSYSNYIVVKKNDFAYNKSSTKIFPQGEIGIVKEEEDCAVPNSIFICFRFHYDIIIPNFAKFLFDKNHHGTYLENIISVGARTHGALQVNKKDLFDVPIPFPSLPEQQKIAACLSSLDDLIAAQTQKIELLQQHKKGLLQGLFPNVEE